VGLAPNSAFALKGGGGAGMKKISHENHEICEKEKI
jgi:hypothetical protein